MSSGRHGARPRVVVFDIVTVTILLSAAGLSQWRTAAEAAEFRAMQTSLGPEVSPEPRSPSFTQHPLPDF